MTPFRTAYIYVNDIFAGLLSETENGYVFSYDQDYINSKDPKPASLSLPITNEPYISNTLFPFFDGLIPEGWLLNVVSKNWKIDRKDRFGILLVACKDSIGNVSIYERKI